MAIPKTVITVNAGNFATVTPGVIRQVQELLVRATAEQINYTVRRQPGEQYVVRVDGRWGAPINTAKREIRAFWAFPGSGEVLKKVWALIQDETYRYPKRRTGTLLNSWRAFLKLSRAGSNQRSTVPASTGSFPPFVAPGNGYSFVNVAPYGSLMSRYSAVAALRGSIAKAAAAGKSFERRIGKLTKTILYQKTPRGYSTVSRIASKARRFSYRTPVLIRAFDLEPTGGLNLKRVSGISVTFLRGITRQDVVKQGRLSNIR